MELARRIYSRELKIAAIREIDSGRSVAEVARQLELCRNTGTERHGPQLSNGMWRANPGSRLGV